MGDLLKTLLGALPNAAQGFSLTRAGIQAAGGSIATTGFTSGNWPLTAVGAVVWLAPAVWGLFSHTDTAKIKAVEALPEVKQIIPKPNAPLESAVMIAAADLSRPKVVLSPRGL